MRSCKVKFLRLTGVTRVLQLTVKFKERLNGSQPGPGRALCTGNNLGIIC